MRRPRSPSIDHASGWALCLAACLAVFGAGGAEAGESHKGAQTTLFGDWGGVRTGLSRRGIDLDLSYTGDVFGNLSGGLQDGAAYEDLFRLEVDADLGRFGWAGATAHVTLLQIDDGGRNVEDLVGALSDPSNIDARPTTRLFTLWVQQQLGHAGTLRLGQIAAGDDFMVSSTASVLINNTFAWANIVDINLPSGGPAYPLATPGARLALDPSEDVKLVAAVFSGDPAGSCRDDEDPQICNRHGTTFSFTGGALIMGEIQYRPQPAFEGEPLDTAYKLGGWFHTGDFADQARGFDDRGRLVSLAVDDSDPLEHQGNWGVYGIVDQVLWRRGARGLAVFCRGGIVPPDRNLVSWYVDAGVAIVGPLEGRADDTLSFGFAYSNISRDAAKVDEVRRRVTGLPYPIRDGEAVLELTYEARLRPWWTLQPDLQYIIHPGGNVPSPTNPTQAVDDSFLIGLRTAITF